MFASKNKILAIMQLPPPIHGQSIMNQAIYESKLINDSFNLKTIPLHFTTLDNLGKPSISKLWKMIYYLFIIIKDLILFKPDFVYFTLSPIGFSFYRDFIYAALIKLFRVPIVFHLHGKGIKKKATNPFNKILYFIIFNNSKIILLSELLTNDLNDVIKGRGQLYFLANGIQTKKAIVKSNMRLNDPLIILFLSNIEKTKGVLVLLDAAEHLIRKNIKFKIKLAGGITPSISEKELYKKIEHLKDYVEYLGPKYGDEKSKLFTYADIFAFPTHYPNEAFPLVLLEVMQAGLPIVSTFEGAIPEIVEHGTTGFILKQKDSIALADKIEILLKDETLRRKMGVAGNKKFLQNYSLEIFEENFLKILNTIIRDIEQKKE
jgi:glycosyltransferase involved in cell wall biosynthesis